MTLSRVGLLIIVALMATRSHGAPPQYPSADWDISQPRGMSRELTFTTSEGTWMSVDVSRDSEWLIFDLLGNIYRVPAKEGGSAECLTCSLGQAVSYHPRFSPDGSQFVFVSDRGGQSNLWIGRVDGSELRPLFLDNDSRIAEPVWMPDGRSIVATRRLRTEMGFYRVRAEIWQFSLDPSVEPKKLVAHRGWQRHWPSPDPSGTYVYFHTMNSFGQLHQIKRVHIVSGEIDDVTPSKSLNLTYPTYAPPLGEYAPEISPDGRFMAFARKIPAGMTPMGKAEYEGRTALWQRDLRTGEETVLIDPITSDAADFLLFHKTRILPGYTWSVDGRSIYYSAGGQLHRWDKESGRSHRIPIKVTVKRTVSEQVRHRGRLEATRDFVPRVIRWPRSSPDGKFLAFEAAGRIYLWERSADSARVIASMPDAVQAMPAWSPDSKWVSFVSLDSAGQGVLWKIRTTGASLTALADSPSPFAYPSWRASGTSIVVSRYSSQAPREVRDLASGWETLSVPVEKGGSGRPALLQTGAAVRGLVGSNEAFHTAMETAPGDQRAILAAGENIPTAVTKLMVGSPGASTHAALCIHGSAANIVPSPDRSWAAVERFREVYVVPVGASAGGEACEEVDLLAEDGARRITLDSGAYANWISREKLEFASGSEYRIYDVRTGEVESVSVPVKIERRYPAKDLFVRGGTIFVGDADYSVIRGGDLLVSGGRIQCVGKCKQPDDAEVFDASGRYIFPGWVDIHTHHLVENQDGIVPLKRASAAAYLAYGVTTTSDPGIYDPFTAAAVADMSESSATISTRSLSQGEMIRCYGTATNESSTWDSVRPITSLQDAKEIVARHRKWGATLLKSYQICSRGQRQMLVEAAREQGLGVTVEAQDLGLVLGGVIDGHTGWEHWLQYLPIYQDVSTAFGTLQMHYSSQTYQAGYPIAGSTEYWAGIQDWWLDDKAARFQPWRMLVTRRAPSGKPVSRFSWPIVAQGVADVAAAGGYTPVGGHSELPGIDSHWEVWALASTMGNRKALRAASYDGAHFLGFEDDIGSLEVGKIADFTILSKDPLIDIRNTMSLEAVAIRGVIYDALTLDEIWPTPRSYGEYPWRGADGLYRHDVAAPQ